MHTEEIRKEIMNEKDMEPFEFANETKEMLVEEITYLIKQLSDITINNIKELYQVDDIGNELLYKCRKIERIVCMTYGLLAR